VSVEEWFKIKLGRTKVLTSFDEFLSYLRPSRIVEILPRRYTVTEAKSRAIGGIGIYRYRMRFQTYYEDGKLAVFQPYLYDRFGSDRGMADEGLRDEWTMKAFHMVLIAIAEMQERCPGVAVSNECWSRYGDRDSQVRQAVAEMQADPFPIRGRQDMSRAMKKYGDHDTGAVALLVDDDVALIACLTPQAKVT
jgi:hypothetical protein